MEVATRMVNSVVGEFFILVQADDGLYLLGLSNNSLKFIVLFWHWILAKVLVFIFEGCWNYVNGAADPLTSEVLGLLLAVKGDGEHRTTRIQPDLLAECSGEQVLACSIRLFGHCLKQQTFCVLLIIA